ncbi:hypothetical protein EVAR_63746_1 [Eumeta japonica]|uniref:Uncharacterized protein n=1 Tax=Eumeta variegata TaxID=151549 RepID=A0A4C1ZRD7_EUMVA|nr:hypothetical protein EVAR_63746_1 [Eumeta japonica]
MIEVKNKEWSNHYLTDRHFIFKHENTHSSRRMIRAEYLGRSIPCTPCTLMIYRDRRQTSSSRYLQTIPPCTCAVKQNATFALTSRRTSRIWLDGSKSGGLRAATDAHWCVKNSVLHRDLDLTSITKYMKDASERFFSVTEFHPNPLLSAAASYEAPPPYHFIHRPRNIITDLPDDFTIEVERLRELNKQNDN